MEKIVYVTTPNIEAKIQGPATLDRGGQTRTVATWQCVGDMVRERNEGEAKDSCCCCRN
jgi:hypothetical protein